MYAALVFAFLLSFGILGIHGGCEFRIDTRGTLPERPEVWKKFGSNELQLKMTATTASYNIRESDLKVKCVNGFSR